MAANFNKPDLSSLEVDAVDEYKERDVDIAKMFDGTSSTNIPTNAIKFDVTAGVLQRREGGAWVTRALDIIDATTGTLSVSRGGTGAATASAARTNLSVPPTSLTISAGTGLNGGGSLSANRTLSVDVGTDSNQIPRNSDLGSAATTDATAYATSAQGDTADSALQSANNLSDVASASASRSNLGLGSVAIVSYDETLAEELAGDFGSGETVNIVKIGKVVTITANQALTFSQAPAATSGSIIPSGYRPNVDVTAATFQDSVSTNGFIQYIIITTAGTLRVQFMPRDSNIFITQTTASPFTISYVVG